MINSARSSRKKTQLLRSKKVKKKSSKESSRRKFDNSKSESLFKISRVSHSFKVKKLKLSGWKSKLHSFPLASKMGKTKLKRVRK